MYVEIENKNVSNDYSVELKLKNYNNSMLKSEINIDNQESFVSLKPEIQQKSELSQEVKSEVIGKTSIQMQSQNVEKILNGTKTTTIRESIPKGGNIAIGETKIVNFSGKDFYVTNRGHLTIQEAGGLENMLKSEGLNSIDDFMYNQSKNWAKGNGKMYIYDIKETTTEPQQLLLFEDESWTEESKTVTKSDLLKSLFTKDTFSNVVKGSVVNYNDKKWIVWNISDSNKAQLINTEGEKFSGTPNLDKLTKIGDYTTTVFNGTDYIVTQNENIYSLATGKQVYTNLDNSTKTQKAKIIEQIMKENDLLLDTSNLTELEIKTIKDQQENC